MTLLLRALWRQLLADRLATFTSLVAIAIATGAIVAVHELSEKLVADLAAGDPSRLIGITHWSRGNFDEARYFELRAEWRSGELGDVAAIVPIVDGNVSTGGSTYRLVGIDPLAYAAAGPEEAHGAAGAELLVGDTVIAHVSTGVIAGTTIPLGRDSLPVRVLDTFGDAGLSARWLVADIATAQRVLDTPGELTAIGIAIPQHVPLWQRLADAAFPGMRRNEETQVERGGLRFVPVADNELGRFSGAILFSLGVLSLLSALVAAFLVYQNACNHVARRAPLRERLHALGAPDPVVSSLLSLESGAIALVGVTLGVIAGTIGAGALLDMVAGGATTKRLSMAGTSLGAWAIAKALVVGFGVAGVATVLAERGQRSNALRASASTAGIVLLAIGSTIGASAVSGSFFAIGGVCLVAIVLLSGWIDFGSRVLLTRSRNLFATLNLRQARASARSVSAALAALLLAVATAIGMGEMVQSFRSAFVESLDRRLAYDVAIDADEPLGAGAIEAVTAVPHVIRVARYVDTVATRADGSQIDVAVTSLDRTEATRYGHDAIVPKDAVLVSEQVAREDGLVAGDRLELVGTRGSVALEVAYVFRDYGAARPRIVVDFDSARRFVDVPPPRRLGVRVSSAEGADAVRKLASGRAWQLRTREQIRADAMTTFERTFAVSDALVVVALVVAVIGMGSAFALLELSRTRELELLDALGVGRARRFGMTLAQVSVLALHVLVLAIPLGLAVGWILCTWLNPAGFGWSVPFGIHTRAIVVPVAFGFVAALVAAAAPLTTREAISNG